MSKNKLPTVTSNIPKDLRYFIDRLREMLDGSKSDRFANIQELSKAGVITIDGTNTVAPPTDIESGDTIIIPVFTPPKPTGFSAVGGFELITLDWDIPNYYGHLGTEIWRANGNTTNINAATFQAYVGGPTSVFSDYVGTNGQFTYWIRFININDVYGPYSDRAYAATAYDVNELLTVLTDRISSTQLATDLYNLTENLDGSYVVNLSNGGVATGFGLATSTTPNGTQTADFAILANTFSLLPPVTYNQGTTPSGSEGEVWRNTANNTFFIYNSGSWRSFDGVPFIVQSTPVTIGGVYVPAGVYIKDAFIKNASIDTAKIKLAAIDTARIADAAITSAKVGTLDAGKVSTGSLKSYNFTNSSGQAGFLLQMGLREVVGSGGISYTQEAVTFILRSAGISTPALQLVNGVVTMNAAVIRNVLQSIGYASNKPGFQFNIENNTFTLRGTGGQILMTAGGLGSAAVSSAISGELAALEADAAAAQSTANTGVSNAATAQSTANTAVSNASTAQSTANTAQAWATAGYNLANAAVTPAELGAAQATKLDQNDFDTLEGQLRAFAFLDKITPANVGTYIGSAAIGRAYIGNLAVGTAQIGNAQITNAKIGTASVDTLKIQGDAVTVASGFSTSSGAFIGSSWTKVGSIVVAFPGTRPSKVLITASCNYLAQYTGNDSGRTLSLAIRVNSGGYASSMGITQKQNWSTAITTTYKAGTPGTSATYGVYAKCNVANVYKAGIVALTVIAAKR